MVDATYGPKVYQKQGGDELIVAAGGKITVEAGGQINVIAPPSAIYFVDPQNGSASSDGLSWASPFAAFSSLDTILDHGDTILFRGMFDGAWTAPTKNDISLIGVANLPRQATDGGVHNGAGATWLNTAVAAPCLTITSQAWRVENIYFNNSDTTDNSSCLKLLNDNSTDAGHAVISGCKFIGEEHGIVSSGGVGYVQIIGCEFQNFDAAGDTAIKPMTGGGYGTDSFWLIKDNYFHNNVNHISAAATGALWSARIIGNQFSWKQNGAVTTTLQVDLGTTAVNCIVMDNYFQNAHAEAASATMFLPQDTANSWLNYYRDGLVALVPAT
jgi:hypothetical protein